MGAMHQIRESYGRLGASIQNMVAALAAQQSAVADLGTALDELRLQMSTMRGELAEASAAFQKRRSGLSRGATEGTKVRILDGF